MASMADRFNLRAAHVLIQVRNQAGVPALGTKNLPGCPFAGIALPGPCSDTAGILMYYEIMALLEQNPSLSPIWD